MKEKQTMALKKFEMANAKIYNLADGVFKRPTLVMFFALPIIPIFLVLFILFLQWQAWKKP